MGAVAGAGRDAATDPEPGRRGARGAAQPGAAPAQSIVGDFYCSWFVYPVFSTAVEFISSVPHIASLFTPEIFYIKASTYTILGNNQSMAEVFVFFTSYIHFQLRISNGSNLNK